MAVGGTVRLLSQLRQQLASGGFRPTNIMSNSKCILSDCPVENLAAGVDLLSGELPLYMVLGVYWDATSDQLKVKVNIKKKPSTCCGLLSMVGQNYDSLCVLQLFILPARHLLQRAYFSQLGWDEGLNSLPNLEHDYGNWLDCLPELEDIQLPRCVLPGRKSSSFELHTFSDACVSNYGACTYLRSVCVMMALFAIIYQWVFRVASLKPITIPPVELAAAALAAKLSSVLRRELDIQFNRAYLWTNAVVVLPYICNASTRFEMFVSLLIVLSSCTFQDPLSNGNMCRA